MGLRRLLRTWNGYARQDPMWAILTWPDKRGNRWNAAEFLATGRAEVRAALARVRALCPHLETRRALDFGCGVGRLSHALAAEFTRVDGVDAAAAMIEAAQALAPPANVHYHANPRTDLQRFDSGAFDFAYSSLTLQHMPPALMRGYLRELARVLAPGGVLCVQIPHLPRRDLEPLTLRRRVRGRSAQFRRWLRQSLARHPAMDMYGMAPAEVEALLGATGMAMRAVEENGMAGPAWISFGYVAERPRISGN